MYEPGKDYKTAKDRKVPQKSGKATINKNVETFKARLRSEARHKAIMTKKEC